MEKKPEKKLQFSYFMHKVQVDKRKLVIKGHRIKTALILLAFAIGLAAAMYKMSQDDVGMFVLSMCSFGLLFLCYGFWDVVFSKSYLELDLLGGKLHVFRKDIRNRYEYEGDAKSVLRVIKKKESRKEYKVKHEMDVYKYDEYSIYLIFDDGKARIPFPLVTFAQRMDSADKLVAEWTQKLHLDE